MNFEKVFKNYIDIVVKEELEKQIESAKVEIETRIRSHADTIALKVLKHYEVTKMQDRIVIEVIK